MEATAAERHLKVFCPVHKISFPAAMAGRILCESGAHALAHSFPHGDFWEYCCDCQNFWPMDVGRDGKGRGLCPCCGRSLAKRYLCAGCKLLSVESDEPAEGKEFFIAPGEAPQPCCPACLRVVARTIRRHRCPSLNLTFMTERVACPLCGEPVEGPASFPASAFELLVEKIDELKDGQDELGKMIDNLTQQTLGGRADLERRMETILHEIEMTRRDIEKVWSAVNKSASAAPDRHYYREPTAPEDTRRAPAEDATTFPIMVEEYLKQVKKRARLVRADVLMGIIVADLEGKGELVLVMDESLTSGLFYVVPRVGRFMTKQEFYLYYERYYDCHRPSAGDVWIVEPAVVGRVEGGWQLKEKGVLEVR